MRLHALAALRLGDLEGQLQHVRGSELDLLRLFGERESCMRAMSVNTTTRNNAVAYDSERSCEASAPVTVKRVFCTDSEAALTTAAARSAAVSLKKRFMVGSRLDTLPRCGVHVSLGRRCGRVSSATTKVKGAKEVPA